MNVTFSSCDHGRSLSTPPLSHRSVMTSRIITRLELPPATTCSGSTHSRSANISRRSRIPSSPP